MTRALFVAILMLGPAAGAQILPGASLPALPGGLPGRLGAGAGIATLAQRTAGALTHEVGRLEHARQARIRRLLRRHPDVIEADPAGDPIVRGEVLAFSPTGAALARAAGAGFLIRRKHALGALGMQLVALDVPRGMPTSRALRLLRQLDPAGTYGYNNIYTQSGAATDAATMPMPMPAGVGVPRSARAILLGLIDGGVATAQPVFRDTVIHRHGCAGAVIPSAHGTEVASLMVGRSAQFGGAAPGATLYAADVYCGKPTGGAVASIVEALSWLVGHDVGVINVSLVGPPNALLREAVARVVARGFLIVAAVGNDGPAAPPLYPAAYPGVVGVTAVDARRRVLFEAERGPQVMFAAPGADIVAATAPAGFDNVRGTSFAAPLVAGLLAARIGDPDPTQAREAVEALAHAAIHLGAPGRNPVYGYGLVGPGLPRHRPGSRQ